MKAKQRQARHKKYKLTFPLQYAYKPHPSGLTWIDPYGYVVIIAKSEDDARGIAMKHFGIHWGFIYNEHHTLNPDLFPKGIIRTIKQQEE